MKKNKAMTLMELLVVLALLSSIAVTIFINFANIAKMHKNITNDAIVYSNINSIFNTINQKDSHITNKEAFYNQSSKEIRGYHDPSDKSNETLINETQIKKFENFNRQSIDNGDIFWSKLITTSIYPRIIIQDNNIYDNPDSSTKMLLGKNFKGAVVYSFSVENDLTPKNYQTGKTNYTTSNIANYKKWVLYISSTQEMSNKKNKTLPLISNSQSKYPRIFYFRDLSIWDFLWDWLNWLFGWLFGYGGFGHFGWIIWAMHHWWF